MKTSEKKRAPHLRRITRAFCASVFCLLGSGALAETHFVAVDGSDVSGDGSLSRPWASITHAVDNASGGDEIIVRPGTYLGRQRLRQRFQEWVLVRSEVPYAARLRYNSGAALVAFTASRIVVEGFDIAHAAGNTGALVIQIQDLLGDVAGEGDGTDPVVSFLTLRNNIIHSSTNNDLLKVNNGAQDILIEGNLFFNQAGSDEHIDINSVQRVVVQENLFLNTPERPDTSSFIVVKDSNGDADSLLGARDITIRRNVFLNWYGSGGQSFLRLGEDGTSHFEAIDVLIENNLMLGNSDDLMRSALTIQGASNVTVRHNTVSGDLPARSFAARLIASPDNPRNRDLVFFNNAWVDPTATMGSEAYTGVDLFDAPSEQTESAQLRNNLYFNAGATIPADSGQFLSYLDDPAAIIADPGLANPDSLVAPVWDGSQFADGSGTIRQAFEALVTQYAGTGLSGALVDSGAAEVAAEEDILGRERGARPDVGALEMNPPLELIYRDRFER